MSTRIPGSQCIYRPNRRSQWNGHFRSWRQTCSRSLWNLSIVRTNVSILFIYNRFMDFGVPVMKLLPGRTLRNDILISYDVRRRDGWICVINHASMYRSNLSDNCSKLSSFPVTLSSRDSAEIFMRDVRNRPFRHSSGSNFVTNGMPGLSVSVAGGPYAVTNHRDRRKKRANIRRSAAAHLGRKVGGAFLTLADWLIRTRI
jgi:hypothetical protein